MTVDNPTIILSDRILKEIKDWNEFNIQELTDSIQWTEVEKQFVSSFLKAADKYLIDKKYIRNCQKMTFGEDSKFNIRQITELGKDIKTQGGEILIKAREEIELAKKDADNKAQAEYEKNKRENEDKIRDLDRQLKEQTVKLNSWTYKSRYVIIAISVLTLVIGILTYIQKIEEYKGKVKELEQQIKAKDSLLKKH